MPPVPGARGCRRGLIPSARIGEHDHSPPHADLVGVFNRSPHHISYWLSRKADLQPHAPRVMLPARRRLPLPSPVDEKPAE